MTNKDNAKEKRLTDYRDEERAQNTSGKISSSFMRNVSIANTKGDARLVDAENGARAVEIKEDGIERRGQKVELSVNERLLLVALADELSNELYSEDEQEAIRRTEWSKKEGYIIGKLDDTIKTFINVHTIANKIYGRGKSEQIRKVEALLCRLEQVEQAFIQGDIRFTHRYFNITGSVELRKVNRRERRFIGIIFYPAVFWNVNKDFCVIPSNLYDEVNKKGSVLAFDLGFSLLANLVSVLGRKWTTADNARRNAKVEAKKYKIADEARKELIAKRVNNALKHELNFETIKALSKTDYESKKQYRAKFRDFLKRFIETAKRLWIITDCKIEKARNGEEKAVFIMSEQLREKTRGKQIASINDNE